MSNDTNTNDTEKKDELLEEERESVALTQNNAKFYRSDGGLISLKLKVEGSTGDDARVVPPKEELFERVIIFRCFPVTNPTEFLSVREADSKKMGRGREIGMIRYMKDFSEEEQKLFLEELDRRYFMPEITKILSVREKFGYTYWDAETTSGNMTFILNNPFSNIRALEDGRVFINDLDGNTFQIPDPEKLDANSYRKIEVYI